MKTWKEDLSQLRDVGWTWPLIAEACAVSVNTAQSWGSGRYTPSGAAQKLLNIAAMSMEGCGSAYTEVQREFHGGEAGAGGETDPL